MKLSQATALVAMLKAAFPRGAVDEATLAIYAESLTDLGEAEALFAVSSLIRTRIHFPAIAEIRETAIEHRLRLPLPDEAWAEVTRQVKKADHPKYVPRWSHAAIREAVKTIGWWELMHTEKPAVTRAHFLTAYEAERNRRIREANLATIPEAEPATATLASGSTAALPAPAPAAFDIIDGTTRPAVTERRP